MILAAADQTALPAGGALAGGRDLFAACCIPVDCSMHPLIEVVRSGLDTLPDPADGPVIIATGPLTEGGLFDAIRDRLGLSTLHFFDAAAPIVTFESIDLSIAFRQSRYGRGGDDYINCPMDRVTYETFYRELIAAELA